MAKDVYVVQQIDEEENIIQTQVFADAKSAYIGAASLILEEYLEYANAQYVSRNEATWKTILRAIDQGKYEMAIGVYNADLHEQDPGKITIDNVEVVKRDAKKDADGLRKIIRGHLG